MSRERMKFREKKNEQVFEEFQFKEFRLTKYLRNSDCPRPKKMRNSGKDPEKMVLNNKKVSNTQENGF